MSPGAGDRDREAWPAAGERLLDGELPQQRLDGGLTEARIDQQEAGGEPQPAVSRQRPRPDSGLRLAESDTGELGSTARQPAQPASKQLLDGELRAARGGALGTKPRSPLRHRLADGDRAALAVWAATRLGMVVLGWMSAWVFVTGPASPGPWLGQWDRWDEGIFASIARHWYFAPGTDPRHVAFFPGFPVALWVMHLVVWNWVAAGLAVSAIAGAVAVVALGRLAADEVVAQAASTEPTATATATATTPPTSLPRAVRERAHRAAADATLFFTLAPAAVFLAAGYSESLFAAFAFCAWAAARRDRWGLAAGLAAGAGAVRVNGLFLAAAIALEFLLAGRDRRRWRQLPWLAVPALPAVAYVVYLRHATGDWMAWQHAQAAGWFRTFQTPKSAWDQTWRAAFGGSQAGHTAWVFQLELAAVLVGLGLTALLLLKRRWPEALYVALSLLALGTTTWFMSVPRAMLLWWPLWTLLATWAARRPMVRTLYVCCVAPIMAGVALLFLSGQWAG